MTTRIERRRHIRICLILTLKLLLLQNVTAFLSGSSKSRGYHRTTRTASSSRQQVVAERVDNTKELDLKSLKQLDNCNSGIVARRILEQATTTSEFSLYNSISIPPGASDRGISDGDLAIQTKIRNKKYGIMDLIDLNGDRDADRASAGVLGVFLASSFSAIAANENLPGPEIVRFVVVWILSFTPLALVGYGIATPENLQTLLVSIQRELFPTYRKRMIQHEAGHFLMAHLLGFPIQGYSANAVKNAVEFYPLNDPNVGLDRASQLGFDTQRQSTPARSDDFYTQPASNPDAPFFSKEGRGAQVVETQSVFRNVKNYTDNPFLKLPSQMEPTKSWPYRGFDHGTVDQLAVVSVAGVCAEILAFGNAEGGVADFSQLRQIFASAEPELTERDMDNRIRFSLGFTITQLRLHLGALDALAAVMERGGSVSECVAAIEQCSNVSGSDGILGDYDVRRRQQFRSVGVTLWEKLLLGEKNADTEETRYVEGRGGGYKEDKRQLIQITGDDPIYIALGIAFMFLAWAANGGLTL
jgi:hypothetical protein